MTAAHSEAQLLGVFLGLLSGRRCATTLSLTEWDGVIRLARQSRLLGVLAHRFQDDQAVWDALDARVLGHLRSAMNYGAYRVQMVQIELDALDRLLPNQLEVVVLKGAAYIAQNMPNARGRMPNDVDLMVRRSELDATETALLEAGWAFEKHDPYDDRYYREWSHELPPMRFPGHGLEVDLHHTITPVTSRVRANADVLFSDTRTTSSPRFRVLHPLDQIVHAVIHLFQDSDMVGRFRDLVDIDGLIRFHLTEDAHWQALVDRADVHNAGELLWYALHYCRKWLGTPVPEDIRLAAPHPAGRAMMEWVLPTACLPRLEAAPRPLALRAAASLGLARYHWLRMPPILLLRHTVSKGWRNIAASLSRVSSTAQ